MMIIISPAKSLDYASVVPNQFVSEIRFIEEAKQLVAELQKLSAQEISVLMKVSDKLAELNFLRYKKWKHPFGEVEEVRQALYAFKGEVYAGLDAYSLSDKEVAVAQDSLRMLSGLYGLLRPLDGIMPYRLEMGTKFKNKGGNNLYQFWEGKITEMLNSDLKENGHSFLVNLASNEYYKAIQSKKIEVPIITPVFMDWKNDKYKVISFYAKKARGLMTRFLIQNQIQSPDDIRAFSMEDYYYNNELSTKLNPVFTRDH